jgi:hypothetical protein
MATSRSLSETGWVAGASLFSGRPDPTWPVRAETARALEALWASLPAADSPPPAPPPLGYRGCFLRSPNGQTWSAYAGVVTRPENGSLDRRRDEGRRFERTLIASAPEGTLPFERPPES